MSMRRVRVHINRPDTGDPKIRYDVERLVHEIENVRAIWDPSCVDYHNLIKQAIHWRAIGKTLHFQQWNSYTETEKTNAVAELKNVWSQVKRSFAEEYESKRRDNSDGQCTVCVDYESLEFLVPSVTSEKAWNSLGRAHDNHVEDGNSDGENCTPGTAVTGNDDGKAEPRTPTEKRARLVRNVGGRETSGGGGYRAAGGLRDVGPATRGRGSDNGDRDRGMPGSGKTGPTVEEHGWCSDDSGESSVAVRTPAERRESGNRRRPGYYNIGTDDGDDTDDERTSVAAKRRKSGRKAARIVRPATVHHPRSYMLLFLPLNATTFPVAADWRAAGGRHAYSSDDTDP